MSGWTFEEAPFFECLLEIKFTPPPPELKRISYKDAGETDGSLYRVRKYPTPPAVKSNQKRKYCCYIWAGATPSSFQQRNRSKAFTQPCRGWIIFQHFPPLSYRRNATNVLLFYRYFLGKCAQELHSINLDHYSYDRLCHVHGSEPSTFFGKKKIPLGEILPRSYYFVEHTPERMLAPSSTVLTSSDLETAVIYRICTHSVRLYLEGHLRLLLVEK